MADLSKVKVGDVLVIRVKVREIGMDGALWCENPFQRTSGRYGAIWPVPIIEHEPAPPKAEADHGE